MSKINMTTHGLLSIQAARRTLQNLIQHIDDIEAGKVRPATADKHLNQIIHPELVTFDIQLRQIKLSMLDIERYLENIRELTE